MPMGNGVKGSLVFTVPINHHTLYSPAAGPQQALSLSSSLPFSLFPAPHLVSPSSDGTGPTRL